MSSIRNTDQPIVLVDGRNGIALVPSPTPLTRLHFFDGKFLRAEDLTREQDYLRELVHRSNRAGGFGVVHGLDLQVADNGGALRLGPGLAIDPEGRVLLLPGPAEARLPIADLLRAARQAPAPAMPGLDAHFCGCTVDGESPASGPVQASNLYVVAVCHLEALCGTEPVHGKVCEAACATGTDRPYTVEGLLVRAIPLTDLVLPTSSAFPFLDKHVRSRVASAYYAAERTQVAALINAEGLRSEAWCLGASAEDGACVPLGVIGVAGDTVTFFDPWTARRERMDAPARKYWQWRMAMRPWSVYLAQILQFQCQLTGLIVRGHDPGGRDPCAEQAGLLGQAADVLARILERYEGLMARASEDGRLAVALAEGADNLGLGGVGDLLSRLRGAGQQAEANRGDALLLRGGIVELPPAGYLPVSPQAGRSINAQVRAWMGEGVDLRFCTVRPDFVAHALEEAQHMERISLTRGLDDPGNKEEVDILVPDGRILRFEAGAERLVYRAQVNVRIDGRNETLSGLARAEALPGGGAQFHAAGLRQEDLRLPADIAVEYRPRPKVAARPAAPVAAPAAPAEAVAEEARRVVANDIGGAGVARGARMAARYLSPGVYIEVADRRAEVDNINNRNEDLRAGFVSMRIEANPFTATPPTTMPISIEAVLGLDDGSWFRGRIRGDLLVQQVIQRSATQVSVRGRLLTVASSESEAGSDGRSDQSTLLVRLELDRSGRFAATLTEVDQGRSRQLVEVDWSRAPFVTASHQTRREEGVETNLSARLERSEDALDPEDPARQLAEAGLRYLAERLASAEPDFLTRARNALFPPLLSTGSLQIEGRHPWVLFHRRRTKTCSIDRPTPVETPVVTVRYPIYLHRADGQASLERLVAEIQRNAAAVRKASQLVGDALFQQGTAHLTLAAGARTDLRDAWLALDPAELATIGLVVSSEGTAPLSAARVAAFGGLANDGVAGADRTDFSDIDVQHMPALPAADMQLFTRGQAPGFILLVTQANAVHEVYTLEAANLDTAVFARDFALAIRSGNPDPLLDAAYLRRLGAVSFRTGAAEILGEVNLDPVQPPLLAVTLGLVGHEGEPVETQRTEAIARRLNPGFNNAGAPVSFHPMVMGRQRPAIAVTLVGMPLAKQRRTVDVFMVFERDPQRAPQAVAQGAFESVLLDPRIAYDAAAFAEGNIEALRGQLNGVQVLWGLLAARSANEGDRDAIANDLANNRLAGFFLAGLSDAPWLDDAHPMLASAELALLIGILPIG